MDEGVAQKLREVFDPMVNRNSGNIILVVASSESGKSTLLANVLLDTFKQSKGFITTFMSPSYDALPIQELILKNLPEKHREKKKKMDPDNPEGFNIEDLYKVKEWMFTKRGWDPTYAHKIYNMRLRLYKNYGEADKVREFRFVLALDDAIDIHGGLIRKVCLTWRNKGISWVQLVQDITNFDCAVRNSAPIIFFGNMNFPLRRKQVVEEYLAPYIPGLDIKEKMKLYSRLTENKCFLLMNHRFRTCYHLNTQNGVVTELPEIKTFEDEGGGVYQIQKDLYQPPAIEDKSDKKGKKRKKDDVTFSHSHMAGGGGKNFFSGNKKPRMGAK